MFVNKNDYFKQIHKSTWSIFISVALLSAGLGVSNKVLLLNWFWPIGLQVPISQGKIALPLSNWCCLSWSYTFSKYICFKLHCIIHFYDTFLYLFIHFNFFAIFQHCMNAVNSLTQMSSINPDPFWSLYSNLIKQTWSSYPQKIMQVCY